MSIGHTNDILSIYILKKDLLITMLYIIYKSYFTLSFIKEERFLVKCIFKYLSYLQENKSMSFYIYI